MDKIRAANEAELIPEALGGHQSLQAIDTKDDLEIAFTTLSQRLSFIADASTPRKLTPGQDQEIQASWWNGEVREAIQESRQAERAYKRSPTQETAQQLSQALHERTRALRRARNTSWRTFMRETTDDSRKLWQVEKWARLRSFLPVTPPKL